MSDQKKRLKNAQSKGYREEVSHILERNAYEELFGYTNFNMKKSRGGRSWYKLWTKTATPNRFVAIFTHFGNSGNFGYSDNIEVKKHLLIHTEIRKISEEIIIKLIVSDDVELFALLLKNKKQLLKFKFYDGHNLINHVCEENAVKILDLLLQSGVDLSRLKMATVSPLGIACRANNVDMVRLLLKSGTPLNLEFDGVKEIHYACINGSAEIVELLCQHGADIEKKDAEGRTPLHYAVVFDSVEVLTFLLENGADHKSVDNLKMSPLECACGLSSDEILYVFAKFNCFEGASLTRCSALISMNKQLNDKTRVQLKKVLPLFVKIDVADYGLTGAIKKKAKQAD